MQIKFTIPGKPKGKERPRHTRSGHTYTPQDTKDYEEKVKWCYRSAAHGFAFPEGSMIDCRIYAYYPIPESETKHRKILMMQNNIRPITKPDYDNIGKIVCDALNGIAYKDDSCVVDGLVRKYYSDVPRVEVVLREWLPPQFEVMK